MASLHKNAPFDDRHPAKFARTGDYADRGNPEGFGDTYWASDTEQLLVGNGTESGDWVDVTGGGGGGGSPDAVGAHLYRASGQSIGSGTTTVISFTDERMDTDSLHEGVTNPSRITIPSGGAGVWFFALHIELTDSGGWNGGGSSRFRIVFRKNDTTNVSSEFNAQVGQDVSNNNYYGILDANFLVTLADADYIEVRAINGANVGTTALAMLTVFRVGN